MPVRYAEFRQTPESDGGRRRLCMRTSLLRLPRSMMSEPPPKRARAGSEKFTFDMGPPAEHAAAHLIGTHSGTFHADEALAVHLIRTLPDYRDAGLVRTRDPAKLAECDIVVDVGGVYDDEKRRYDHHQRGFNETYDSAHRTKLSSAGLIYKHYGPRIVANRLETSIADPSVPILVSKVYDDFVEALDGIDNGISQYEAASGEPLHSRYKSRTDLSSRIARLNPSWDEPSTDAILDAKFVEASALAGREFFAVLEYLAKSWLPARDLVKTALTTRMTTPGGDQKGRLVVFDHFAPWKEHLFELEQSLQIEDAEKPLYVLYPDESSKWRIQAVPVSSESFESRKALPEPWRGLRDEELSAKSGVPGCIFIHASGFIGGHQTKEGALSLAHKALTF